MKHLIITVLVCSFLCSCINKTPEVDEAKYIAAQKDYEEKKQLLSVNKAEYFKDNSAVIIAKMNAIKKLADSTKTFEEAPTDSTLVFNSYDLKLNNMPYRIVIDDDTSVSLTGLGLSNRNRRSSNNLESKSAIFIAKENNKFAVQNFKDVLTDLYPCIDTPLDANCTNLNVEELEKFKAISLAFIIEGYSIIKPTLDDSKNFSSGLFFASITAFDLEQNRPLIRFRVSATNSEEIQYRKEGFMSENPREKINQDYRANIRKEILTACRKHFEIKNY